MRRDGDTDDCSNPFVRFKRHVDSGVASALSTISAGFPSFPRTGTSPPPPTSTSTSTSSSTSSSPASSSSTSPSPSPASSSSTSPSPSPSPASPHSSSMASPATPPPPSPQGSMDVDGKARHPAAWDVFSLVASPSYSPSSLRHLLPPVPSDLPSGLDSSIFTFEDALEDLLAVSQGRHLPEIITRYEQRSLLRRMFPSGEPTWFWMRRLESQGLVENPTRRRFFRALAPPDWDAFHRELDTRAAEAWREATAEAHGDQDAQDWFRQVGRAFRQLEHGLAHHNPPEPEPCLREADSQRPREPDTFDHLFSSISSTFAEGQKSWDTFLKIISDQTQAPGKQQTTGKEAGDTKQVETRDEYVDRFGYLHSTVTRKTLDEDGNEIGRETYVTMRPAKTAAKTAHGQLDDHAKDELDDVDVLADETGRPRSGWFWR